MPPLPDEDLMEAIAQADGKAFAALLSRHVEKVRAIGWRMLGSRADADDLAQDVFLRIWKNPAAYDRKKGRFSTWLYRVAANACIDRLRRRAPEPLDERMAEALAAHGPGPERALLEAEQSAQVRAAIAQLPQRQKLALVLSHDLGHTNIEIARIMDTSVEAVESLLGRARRKLKGLLSEQMKALVNGKGAEK